MRTSTTALAAILAAALVPASASAGPIFVTGHDPDFHSQDDLGARSLMNKSINFVRQNSAFPGKPMLWVESRIPIWSGHRRGRDGMVDSGFTEGVDFVWYDASQLDSMNWSALLDNFSAIAVASDFGGMLSQAELDRLNAHKAEIAAFFNNGGGIWAASEGDEGGNLTPNGGEFQFIPLAITSESSASPPYRVADDGKIMFGLADGDVSAPSHSHFTATSGLKIVSWDAANHIMSLAGFAKIATGTGGQTGFVEGPVGQWLFEGNGDDASGSGRTLSLAGGPGFAAGLFGQALDLHKNGGQYAVRPVSDPLYDFGSSDFTVQAWVNFNDTSTEQTIVEKFNGQTGPGWTLTKLIDNRLHFWASPSAVLYSPQLFIATGVWHHLLIRRIGTRFSLFFDGRIVAQADNSNPVPPTTQPLLIGRRNAADGRDFSVDGRIDEVAIWARGLTDGEVGYLWGSGQGRTVDAQSVVVAGNSTLDKFPNGDPIPNGTQITTQLQESAGANFSSTNGGAISVTSVEASSPPSMLVGGNGGSADSFQPIDITIVDPVTGQPRTASQVFLNLISVGDAEVSAAAYSASGLLLDQKFVQHLGAGVGFGNVDPVTLNGNGIAEVVVSITKPFPGDGFGIDDLYVVLGNSIQLNSPPTVDAGGDRTANIGANGLAHVTLTATGTDPDNDPITYAWAIGDGGTATGQTITVDFPLGVTKVVVTAADGKGGTGSQTFYVTAIDVTPPSITNVPAPVTLEQANAQGSAYTLPSPTVSDNSGHATLSSDAPAIFPAGTTTVTFTAVDGSGNKTTATTTVTVHDTTPPTLSNVPAPVTLEQATWAGNAYSVPLPSAWDAVTANPLVTTDAPAIFRRGTTTVTFTATDAAGNSSHATTTVTVRDTTPPAFVSLAPSTATLWPPNHKLVPITIAVALSDNGDPHPTAKIVSVTSNEPANGLGDGNTASDWVITGDLSLELRAERAGGGGGRVYTVTVRATDDSGNHRDRSVTVGVPANLGLR